MYIGTDSAGFYHSYVIICHTEPTTQPWTDQTRHMDHWTPL